MNLMMEFKLYFGRSQKNGSVVTDDEWLNFCQREIDPVFSEGYTVDYGSSGYWHRTPEGMYLLTVIAPLESREDLMYIALAYNETFGQDAVYFTSTPLKDAFLVEGTKDSLWRIPTGSTQELLTT
jgi:Protein of unknown function (DUF3574)